MFHFPPRCERMRSEGKLLHEYACIMHRQLTGLLCSDDPQYDLWQRFRNVYDAYGILYVVKKSSLRDPRAGLGVFACRNIPKGKVIMAYSGFLLTRERARACQQECARAASHFKSLYYRSDVVINGYKYVLEEGQRAGRRARVLKVLMPRTRRRPIVTPGEFHGLGSMINHSLRGANCEFFPLTSGACYCLIKSRRPISSGEELFVNYGNRSFNISFVE